jgi:D-alanyl-lipoteichoic acid acyltransferase DltB (MBOAT superfamily)
MRDISCGLKLIAVGLFAKANLADALNAFCYHIDINKLCIFDSGYDILSRSVIIYADFWGCSAIAIGLALLFGV